MSSSRSGDFPEHGAPLAGYGFGRFGAGQGQEVLGAVDGGAPSLEAVCRWNATILVAAGGQDARAP